MGANSELFTGSSIHSLLSAVASRHPDSVALLGTDRADCTFAQLLQQMHYIAAILQSHSISIHDRVVTVVRDSADMATLFLGVSSAAACAPLNPSYQRADLEFYLSDLAPKLVLVEERLESPVRDVAREKGIEVVELTSAPGGFAGEFRLGASATPGTAAFSTSTDVALVLHTSGTTSRPKMVPLTHANLCRSARNISESLLLSPADRCLNIMPLFHIHGLVGALLSSMSAGASVACSLGFNATEFYDQLAAFRPTWYTGVPTMHQAILARAHQNAAVIDSAKLRFIRSCSSALPPKTLSDLERTFDAPVVEAYGMTEASHQMTSNPLPPRVRKPGSVGFPTGIQVGILDEEGKEMSSDTIGEIAIRGESVTSGYHQNPEANSKAFVRGWFRTGDQGRIDEDGYVWITGRIKELINRGGEKISPREIDELILTHPAVAQALTFSIPDPKLGEEIGAAIVCRQNTTVTELQLLEFLAEKTASFKVPRKVVFLDKLPLGPTGKPQRIGLAQRLGITSLRPAEPSVSLVSPRNDLETRLAVIWREIFRQQSLGVFDNFFDLGGDSILAMQLASRIRKEFSAEITLPRLLTHPTIAETAEWLSTQHAPETAALAQTAGEGK